MPSGRRAQQACHAHVHQACPIMVLAINPPRLYPAWASPCHLHQHSPLHAAIPHCRSHGYGASGAAAQGGHDFQGAGGGHRCNRLRLSACSMPARLCRELSRQHVRAESLFTCHMSGTTTLFATVWFTLPDALHSRICCNPCTSLRPFCAKTIKKGGLRDMIGKLMQRCGLDGGFGTSCKNCRLSRQN